MGVENRKGNLYYYRKRREGDKVVSEYVGKGEVVELEQKRAAIERERKRQEREAIESISLDSINSGIERFSNIVDALTNTYLSALGYHRHKGQWRRRRD